MTLRLANISNELIGISQATPINGVFPSGAMCDLEYLVVGLDGSTPVQVLIFIPEEQEGMPKAPVTTRPKDGKNPDTTGAGGPAMDPHTGISPPEAIPTDQGTYQDQNEQFTEEEVKQQAANLTGQPQDGTEPENKITESQSGDPNKDTPATPASTPSEPAPDEFADLDNPPAA